MAGWGRGEEENPNPAKLLKLVSCGMDGPPTIHPRKGTQ